jgi:transposase
MSDDTIEPAAGVATAHTIGRMSGRIKIVGRVSRRRRWTIEQKLAILGDAFGPDGSVRAAVERHEVGSGAIYTLRRQAMSGALSGVPARPQAAFAKVLISEPPVMLPAPPVEAPADARTAGQIGIELPSDVRLTVGRTATGRLWVYQSTTAHPATRPRLRHGIASRPTAPVHIRKPILRGFKASSRPTPMPVTTRFIEAAPPKSRAGPISGGRCRPARAGCRR